MKDDVSETKIHIFKKDDFDISNNRYNITTFSEFSENHCVRKMNALTLVVSEQISWT